MPALSKDAMADAPTRSAPIVLTKLIPVLAVRDLDEALRYYTGVLGWSEAWKWGEPPHRAGVAIGDFEIQLDAGGRGATPGQSIIYCHMTGVEDFYRQCQRRSARMLRELEQRPWGVVDFQVEDPSGNRVGFAELLK